MTDLDQQVVRRIVREEFQVMTAEKKTESMSEIEKIKKELAKVKEELAKLKREKELGDVRRKFPNLETK